MAIVLNVPATWDNYDETAYLAANSDVAESVRAGRIGSGRQHFSENGQHEGRHLRRAGLLDAPRRDKIERVTALLLEPARDPPSGAKYDFRPARLREAAHNADPAAAPSDDYDRPTQQLIAEAADGLVLECSAIRRAVYYENVVTYGVVDYDTTDILGANDRLPFRDRSFDAVISTALLAGVRDPARCAAEIARVLKPGGRLRCSASWLQPADREAGQHYFNITHRGLRVLFERLLLLDEQQVGEASLPAAGLAAIVGSWARGLSGPAREEFLALPLRELLAPPSALRDRAWVRDLSAEKNFELAGATLLRAHKADWAKPEDTRAG